MFSFTTDCSSVVPCLVYIFSFFACRRVDESGGFICCSDNFDNLNRLVPRELVCPTTCADNYFTEMELEHCNMPGL
ncbi:hypothetical protein Y032_0008g324 [Ancylostoma ceylanicum]|uniref:Uncharacterized protein n=1 Tax=Ancylostoma ceylanicum TaxID=53326 RepID=A0A016VMW9_9BILA|nr:hypothetical protein Y032_0008g324 [Ancylostoma ceylanicum]